MALTTVCPQCKAICALQESAVGKLVACSRCRTVFTAEPSAAPVKVLALARKPAPRRRVGVGVFLLLLFGTAGTLAIVIGSFVFFFYQYEEMKRDKNAENQRGKGGDMRLGNHFFGGRDRGVPDPDEQNVVARKDPLPESTVASAPPAFVVPKVIAKPVDLTVHPSVGEYRLTIQTWLKSKRALEGGPEEGLLNRTKAEFAETIQAVDPEERASAHLRYRSYAADASREGGTPLHIPGPDLRDDLAQAEIFVLRDQAGVLAGQRLDLSQVSHDASARVQAAFKAQGLALEFLSVPLPNRAPVEPGSKWTYQREVSLPVDEEHTVAVTLASTLEYRGMGKMGNRDVAILSWNGQLQDTRSSANASPGELKGWVSVDPSNGAILQAHAVVTFDFSHASLPKVRSATGAFHLLLHRVLARVDEGS
jgi:hypothetical protein